MFIVPVPNVLWMTLVLMSSALIVALSRLMVLAWFTLRIEVVTCALSEMLSVAWPYAWSPSVSALVMFRLEFWPWMVIRATE